jgi:hypothetical protein
MILNYIFEKIGFEAFFFIYKALFPWHVHITVYRIWAKLFLTPILRFVHFTLWNIIGTVHQWQVVVVKTRTPAPLKTLPHKTLPHKTLPHFEALEPVQSNSEVLYKLGDESCDQSVNATFKMRQSGYLSDVVTRLRPGQSRNRGSIPGNVQTGTEPHIQ